MCLFTYVTVEQTKSLKDLSNWLLARSSLFSELPTRRPMPSHVAVPIAQRLGTASGGPVAWIKPELSLTGWEKLYLSESVSFPIECGW